jgi:hypothetical protein
MAANTGSYASAGAKSTAEAYAGLGGEVFRMALNPSARIITYRDAEALFTREMKRRQGKYALSTPDGLSAYESQNKHVDDVVHGRPEPLDRGGRAHQPPLLRSQT